MEEDIKKLRLMRERASMGGGKEKIEAQHRRGKLTARERIEGLLDAGSFVEIDPFVTHRCVDFGMDKKKALGDGVVTGFGTIDGRPVYVYAQDFTFLGGSLSEMHSRKICKIFDLAIQVGAPLIGLNDSGGARIHEGADSLAGYGELFRRNIMASGVIPQIIAVMGPCAGGATFSPALADFIIMVEKTSQMFVTSPKVIREVTKEKISFEELGGADIHSRKSGVAALTAENDLECLRMIRRLLSYLPSSSMDEPAVVPSHGNDEREDPHLAEIVPEEKSEGYDMIKIISRVMDPESLLELHERFAPNVITGFARLNGYSVGVVANQPLIGEGHIDIDASIKIARFVRFCDSFNIPLFTFVDNPGFKPGIEQEHGGVIRHGAKVIYAYSEASVPKITLILRRAYGGGYIAMGSKHLGADLVFAWPTAEIAVMGPESAVNIVFRRELESAEDREEALGRFISEYKEKFSSPYLAASRGYLDQVIEPQETRTYLIKALEILRKKKLPPIPPIKHRNMPL